MKYQCEFYDKKKQQKKTTKKQTTKCLLKILPNVLSINYFYANILALDKLIFQPKKSVDIFVKCFCFFLGQGCTHRIIRLQFFAKNFKDLLIYLLNA